MSTVNTGWLKDDNGEKFAPKTLSSQVITNDGVTLESVINENISTAITNLDAVDLTSAQTISGVKTFSNGIQIGSASLIFDSSAGALVISFPEAATVEEGE